MNFREIAITEHEDEIKAAYKALLTDSASALNEIYLYRKDPEELMSLLDSLYEKAVKDVIDTFTSVCDECEQRFLDDDMHEDYPNLCRECGDEWAEECKAEEKELNEDFINSR